MEIENKILKCGSSFIYSNGMISTFISFGDISIGNMRCLQILMPKDPNYGRLYRILKDWKDEN